jgi:hypothetical protein
MQLILPVSGCGTNASVRVSSNLFPARALLGDHFLGLRRLAEKPAVVANIDGPSAGEKGSRIVPRPSTRR